MRTLDELTSGPKADRRIAVETAGIREVMEQLGSSIPPVPRPLSWSRPLGPLALEGL